MTAILDIACALSPMPPAASRQLALQTLQAVAGGAFADVALDRSLAQSQLGGADRRLVTELVYGCIRRQRSLDALIGQFSQRPAQEQPPELRFLLHLGFYQLRYLSHIPVSAAVNTTVDLAKLAGLGKLAGVVNGVLRAYLRTAELGDPLQLPEDPRRAIALRESCPDWIVDLWGDSLPLAEVEALCQWLNHPPSLDLRVNPLRASRDQVQESLRSVGIESRPLAGLPLGLRLQGSAGAIAQLPGFAEGWWMVQDSSAQLVSQILDPQAGETIIDACAAPGGKTTHLAQLMGDQGTVWAIDPTTSRLKKVQANAQRLGLTSIQIKHADARQVPDFAGVADRVLVDAPCSGLGTLHRHTDARWRQTPEKSRELALLQSQLLEAAAGWLKPGGRLVYATCTLHPQENERVVQDFLSRHPAWQVSPPAVPGFEPGLTAEGFLKLWPHRTDTDGFFVACLTVPASPSAP
jgi:16S rRNA (cytosine967-C5)-methyltransferase